MKSSHNKEKRGRCEFCDSKESLCLSCGHKFCQTCGIAVLSNELKCPICQNKCDTESKLDSDQLSNADHVLECSICFEALDGTKDQNLFITPCDHIFCLTCIAKSLLRSNLCPYCRSDIGDSIKNEVNERIKKFPIAIQISDTVQPNATELPIIQVEGEFTSMRENFHPNIGPRGRYACFLILFMIIISILLIRLQQ